MLLIFFFSFGQLNLSSLSEKKTKKMIDKTKQTVIEVIKLFEYRKSNEGY